MTICVGTRFGRYEILHELGRGAMGVVYQARDPQIDRLVALKTISLDTQDPDDAAAFRSRFFQEAKAAGRLSHPGIVQVFDVGEEPSTHSPYLVMELVPGRSLNQHINAAGGKLPLEDALGVAEQVADALAHAHSQGVVHRDIKPSNILITEAAAKITDFGVARLGKTTMTLPGQMFGTPSYMAPEQLTGGLVDGRADLFALGVILYLMLCGHKPFQGLSNRTVRHNVVHHTPVPVSALDLEISPQVAAIVLRAIEKDPARRYQTGTEMALAIQRLHDPAMAAGSAIAAHDQRDRAATSTLLFTSDTASRFTAGSKPTEMADLSGVVVSVSSEEPRRADLVLAHAEERVIPLAMRERSQHHGRVLLATFGVATIILAGYISSKHLHVLSGTSRSGEISNGSASVSPASTQAVRHATAPSTATADTSAQHRGASLPSTQFTTALRVTSNSGRAAAKQGTPKTPARDRLAEQPPGNALASKLIPQSGAVLSLDINHPFDQARVHVWIDNHLAFTDTLRRNQKKRFGLFNRTQGRRSSRVNVSPGEHRIGVRIQASGFDQSWIVAKTFVLNDEHTLHIKCDKRNNDFHLRFD